MYTCILYTVQYHFIYYYAAAWGMGHEHGEHGVSLCSQSCGLASIGNLASVALFREWVTLNNNKKKKKRQGYR